jgi:NADH pyrophosphatase NudC (nudix superfamily)
MHTLDDIIKAKKHLLEKGYDTESEFTLFKVAELMAGWAAKIRFTSGAGERSDQYTYNCKVCGKPFCNNEDLYEHYNEEHN